MTIRPLTLGECGIIALIHRREPITLRGASDTVEQTYRYARSSRVWRPGGVGEAFMLATSGGSGPAGALANPWFFDGFTGHAEQVAAALLLCARVARTRFYVPLGGPGGVLADPVVTCDGDRLRFESFSSCCGLYVRLDLLADALDGAVLGRGTTNVDFGAPVRQALARVGGIDPLRLSVGADELVLQTMDGTVAERRVVLPERWLKGLAEVQIAASRMTLAAELPGPAARSSCAGCRARGVGLPGPCHRPARSASHRLEGRARCARRVRTGSASPSR
jgi:hypothetical protein